MQKPLLPLKELTYRNAGGGGEKVLFTILRAVEQAQNEIADAYRTKEVKVIIYTCEPENVQLSNMIELASVSQSAQLT